MKIVVIFRFRISLNRVPTKRMTQFLKQNDKLYIGWEKDLYSFVDRYVDFFVRFNQKSFNFNKRMRI